jgi:urea transport system permease protein
MTGTDVITALFNGLSFSSILILTALGLAITFGVMRVINMAHGDMMMLGAYTGYVFTDPQSFPRLVRNLGANLAKLLNLVLRPDEPFQFPWQTDFGFSLNLYWAIPISFLVVGAFGFFLEVCLIRFLYTRPLDTLLATWGVGLMLQQLVRASIGADLHALSAPPQLQGHWGESESLGPFVQNWLFGANITNFRVFIIVFTTLSLVVVYLWFYKTGFGLKVRAVTQNRAMASALGISTRRVDSLTFALGTGLAGVAGCIFAHLYNFSPEMGNDYVVDAFMVVIMGGIGQLPGTIMAGILMGTSQSMAANLFAKAPLQTILSRLPFSDSFEQGWMVIGRNLILLACCAYVYRHLSSVGSSLGSSLDRRHRWSKALLPLCRGVLASAFFLAAVVEITDRQSYRDCLAGTASLPAFLEGALIRFLPLIELGLGSWLLWGRGARQATLAAAVLLGLYTLHGLVYYGDSGYACFLRLSPDSLDDVLKFFGTEMMARVIVLVAVLGLILYRPAGLFAPKERVYE